MRDDQGEDASGLQRIDRFGEEEIVQRQLLAAIVELEVGEGNVADRCVDAALGQLRIAEAFDPDVVPRMKGSGNPAGNRIEFDADEALFARSSADEISDAAAGLQDGGIVGYA